MKCIQCNKEVQTDKSVLCLACMKEKHTCLKGYEEHTLLICSGCSKYKYGKNWKKAKNKDDAIKESIMSHCSFAVTPKKIAISVKLKEPLHNKQQGEAHVSTTAIIEAQVLEENFVFPLKITYTNCDSCALTKTNYFEGVLQLRGIYGLEKAYDFIVSETAKRKDVVINKIEEQKHGYDFYYTKQRYIPRIMQKLVERFGATGSTHPTLFTRKQGKDLYRVTAIVRLPLYSTGSVVMYKNKIMQIVSFGKRVRGTDLMTGDAVSFAPKERVVVLVQPEKFVSVEVTKKYPYVEVLHPETFQSVAVKNQRKIEKEFVSIAVIDKDVWVVG